MLNQLFGAHSVNLQNAMSRTSERHGLLSKNLANVNTPGYKRQDLDFGVVLEQTQGSKRAMALMNDPNLSSEERLRAFREGNSARSGVTTDDREIRIDGSSVDLEKEVTAMAETEIRYQTLTDMTASYFSGLKNVIREGK